MHLLVAILSKSWSFTCSCEDSIFLQIHFLRQATFKNYYYFDISVALHPQLRLTSICKILLCSVPYLSTTYSCIQNKSWAAVLSRGELCNDQSQKPLGMGEISTLILLKMNGWNEFDKLVFSQIIALEGFWSCLDPPPFSFCVWVGEPALLFHQHCWPGCCTDFKQFTVGLYHISSLLNTISPDLTKDPGWSPVILSLAPKSLSTAHWAGLGGGKGISHGIWTLFLKLNLEQLLLFLQKSLIVLTFSSHPSFSGLFIPKTKLLLAQAAAAIPQAQPERSSWSCNTKLRVPGTALFRHEADPAASTHVVPFNSFSSTNESGAKRFYCIFIVSLNKWNLNTELKICKK